MKNASYFIEIEKNKQEQFAVRKISPEEAQTFRLEQAKINYEHACANTIRFCDERIDTLITEQVQEKGINNFELRFKVVIFTDELNNKLFKVVTSDGYIQYSHSKVEFFTANSSDFCYKTFQNYLKKNGFRCIQEKAKDAFTMLYLGRTIYYPCNVLNITFLTPPQKVSEE